MTESGAGPRQVVEEWVRRVWTEGDESAIDELFVPDGKAHGIKGEALTGPDDFKPFFNAMHAACDNIRCELTELMVGPDGERCMFWLQYDVCHPRAEGTVRFETMGIVVVRDGKIVDAWNVVDWGPLLTAAGIMPADAIEQFLTPSP